VISLTYIDLLAIFFAFSAPTPAFVFNDPSDPLDVCEREHVPYFTKTYIEPCDQTLDQEERRELAKRALEQKFEKLERASYDTDVSKKTFDYMLAEFRTALKKTGLNLENLEVTATDLKEIADRHAALMASSEHATHRRQLNALTKQIFGRSNPRPHLSPADQQKVQTEVAAMERDAEQRAAHETVLEDFVLLERMARDHRVCRRLFAMQLQAIRSTAADAKIALDEPRLRSLEAQHLRTLAEDRAADLALERNP